jgi:hypothetical protein
MGTWYRPENLLKNRYESVKSKGMKFTGFIFSALLLLIGCQKSGEQSITKEGFLILDMVHHNPGEPLFHSAFTNPEKLAKYGYSGKVLNDFKFAHCAITYSSLNKQIFPVGGEGRRWVDSTALYIEKEIDAAHAAGIELLCFTDIMVIPRKMLEIYKDSLCNAEGKIDFHRPFTQKVHRIMVDEIFRRFPKLDGLVIRTGETYLHNVPFHVGNSPVSQGVESHKILINLLRDEICVKRNKKLIYRTWDFGNFHTQPDYYLAVTNAVETHPKLYFAIKHTNGDYHRTFKFNPTITLGKHKQIIEVQCQREYEGKGAYPNYVMKGVIDGFEEYANDPAPKSLKDISNHPTFAGIWSWSRGGGWRGPYISNELWCDLNAFVISRYAQTPQQNEAEIFELFTDELGLTNEDKKRFRQIALLSADAVIRQHSSLIADINVWWTRDMFLGGEAELGSSFQKIIENNQVDAVLHEKKECTALWGKIVNTANLITSGSPDFRNYLKVSSEYGFLLASITEQAWTIWLLGMTGDKTGEYDTKSLATAFRHYDELWAKYRLLKEENQNCATLYIPYAFVYKQPDYHANNGMQQWVEHYRDLYDTQFKTAKLE